MSSRALVVALVIAASTAHATPRASEAGARQRLVDALGEIAGHVHALRYAQARDAARAALAIGAASRDELAGLWRTLGEVSAALDDAPAAERWFLAWLTVDPQALLPPGTSPKLTERLAAVRERGAGLAIRRAEVVGDTVQIEADGDPGANVAQIAVRRAGQERAVAPMRRDGATGALAASIGVPAGDDAVEVSFRDEHGNELVATTIAAAASRPTAGARRRRPRAVLARPWPWVAGAAVVGVAGGVFVWRRQVARDRLDDLIAHSAQHTFAEADAARERAELHGWLAAGSFALAGGFAVVAIALAVRGDEVVVAPVAGGAVVGAGARF